MPDEKTSNSRPRLQSIKQLMGREQQSEPVTTIAEYVSAIREISDQWQKDDWKSREVDDDFVLNNTRIVGQVWFRGHLSCDVSLRPGLYRAGLQQNLAKQPYSPKPETLDLEEERLQELFNLEHDQRIDFTTYGHLLNEANHAKTSIDWYFLMQHHGIPTRLLDWTTNALGALFFSLDNYRQRIEERRRV